jgi:maltokinase
VTSQLDATDVVDSATDALAEWMPQQRWFAGKGTPVRGLRVVRATSLPLGGAAGDRVRLLHAVVAVDQGGPRPHLYQLLLGVRGELPDHLAPFVIAHRPPGVVYDAIGDTEVTGRLLALIAEGAQVDGIEFAAEPDAEIDLSLRGRPVGADQSNTSLVYSPKHILKLFRHLELGTSPDLELHRALHKRGCPYIAAPQGAISGELDGQPVTFGILQAYLGNAVEGWALATASVRDLMAEADLHADEVGGDFASEAQRLGAAVAAVHADLAATLGSALSRPGEIQDTVDGMHRRLDRVRAVVPALAEHEESLRTAFEAARASTPVRVQRIHGDLHLGQTLRSVNGWVLIDFEGEPAAPLAERTGLRSPLRDVAGMLRSFDYAAHQLLVGADPGQDDRQLTYRAREWSDRNRHAFVEGYVTAAHDLDPHLSDPREHAPLLRALELDKAVYEVAYERDHRPDWLPIPLASISKIASGEDGP